MSTRFVNVDRQTPLLFPPDLRDWVRQDDLVHFVLDAVEVLPLHKLRVNGRGTGSEQFPPKMMLALLIYSYATGTFSSRAIEGMTYSHVSVRYGCANTHPDHNTICRFRVANRALLEETFVKVLELAGELKLSQVGTVAIDGTKVAANASKHAAVSYGRAGEIIKRLEDEVQTLLMKAEAADSVPLQEGLSIPVEIARREDRQQKLRQARAAIEARVLPQQEAQRAEYAEKMAARQAKRDRGEAVRGREPQPPASEPEAGEQYNFTDPESRIMKAGNGQHFEQSYNAQAAVAVASLLIVGQRVSDAPNDKEQLQPTVLSIPASLGQAEKVLVDAGFFNGTQIEAVENPGADQTGRDAERDEDGDDQSSNDQSGNDQSGNDQSGNDQSGNDQSGNDQSGNDQSGNDQSGNDQSGNDQSGNDQSGNDSAGDDSAAPGFTPAPVTVVYAATGRIKHDRPLAEYEAHPDPAAPAPEASLVERMQHRLGTAEGKAVYKLRKHTVEPVFGIIKHVLGFRRFSLRGREKAGLEWTLVCLAWNFKRLHTLGMGAKMGAAA